jgi:hypothetical protein
LLAAALAGCGGSSQGNGVASKTPAEILASAKILADAASSVHVYGSIQSGGSPLTLNLYLQAGRGARGQLTENGYAFEIIQRHHIVYIKGSSGFYSHIAGPTAAQLLQGRWLKVSSPGTNLAALASLTDLHQLLDSLLSDHGQVVKGKRGVLGGHGVLAIRDPSEGGTLYVATTGPPYPVEVTKGGAASGSISLDDWNMPVTVLAPQYSIDVARVETPR